MSSSRSYESCEKVLLEASFSNGRKTLQRENKRHRSSSSWYMRSHSRPEIVHKTQVTFGDITREWHWSRVTCTQNSLQSDVYRHHKLLERCFVEVETRTVTDCIRCPSSWRKVSACRLVCFYSTGTNSKTIVLPYHLLQNTQNYSVTWNLMKRTYERKYWQRVNWSCGVSNQSPRLQIWTYLSQRAISSIYIYWKARGRTSQDNSNQKYTRPTLIQSHFSLALNLNSSAHGRVEK